MQTKYEERKLFKTKWFDYRFLNKEQTNFMFIKSWLKKYHNFKLMHGTDSENVLFLLSKRGFQEISIKEFRSNLTWWLAITEMRQWADLHGMTYEDFWAWYYTSIIKCGISEFKHRQTVLNSAFCKPLRGRWVRSEMLKLQRETNAKIMNIAKSKQLMADNYKGYQIQDDYYFYVVRELVERHPQNAGSMMDMLIGNGEINASFIVQKINKHLLKKLLDTGMNGSYIKNLLNKESQNDNR